MAMVLMMKPKLIMLDEPSLSLFPVMTAEVFEAIKHINKDGMTVIMVE